MFSKNQTTWYPKEEHSVQSVTLTADQRLIYCPHMFVLALCSQTCCKPAAHICTYICMHLGGQIVSTCALRRISVLSLLQLTLIKTICCSVRACERMNEWVDEWFDEWFDDDDDDGGAGICPKREQSVKTTLDLIYFLRPEWVFSKHQSISSWFNTSQSHSAPLPLPVCSTLQSQSEKNGSITWLTPRSSRPRRTPRLLHCNLSCSVTDEHCGSYLWGGQQVDWAWCWNMS